MSREKKQSFMGGVTIMAIPTIFVKICGALYKIPLGNILGDEGLTYFQSAYSIYAVLLTLSTTGLPLALSKLISEAHAANRRTQIRRCFYTAMILFVALGIAGTPARFFPLPGFCPGAAEHGPHGCVAVYRGSVQAGHRPAAGVVYHP